MIDAVAMYLGYLTVAVLLGVVLARASRWIQANGRQRLCSVLRRAPRWLKLRVVFSLWYLVVAILVWWDPRPMKRMYLRERRAMRRQCWRNARERMREEMKWGVHQK